MTKILLIAACGGIGAVLRYALAGWGQKLGSESFPSGTLMVNVTGCLLIGILAAFFSGHYLVRPEYRIAIMVGLLGGFTTFSSYALETLDLARGGQLLGAGVNVLLSNGIGLLVVWLGYRIGRFWFGV